MGMKVDSSVCRVRGFVQVISTDFTAYTVTLDRVTIRLHTLTLSWPLKGIFLNYKVFDRVTPAYSDTLPLFRGCLYMRMALAYKHGPAL